MIHTSYADYVACLYQFNGGVVARLTAAGTTFEIKKIIFGLLEEQPACALIHLCAQKALNHNIAIFPYPSLNQLEEVWVFEATPAAAYYLFKAKKTYRKETSEKNYAKILAFLKTALKIQGSRPELEKAILDIKQVLFYLQIEDRARLYLSSDAEVEVLLKSIKDRPTFEVIVERINAYVDEKQAHSYLMQAMVYELLLDQPLLAAHSYICLAQLSESTQALACMQKALLFFKKTGLALNYAHFLEKIDRKFLVRFVENPLISLELYVRSEMKQLG